jgi:hypothetical protein
VLRCGAADAAQCLQDHFLPRLRLPKLSSDGKSIRALSPCHADHEPSLSVGIKDGLVLVNCFATRCTSKSTRRALIRLGISPACLPRSEADERDAEAEQLDILRSEMSAHHKVLRLAAMLAGYDDLPKGDALAELAESVGVSRREAFRARAALHPVTQHRTPRS